jgi:hypothetical protein
LQNFRPKNNTLKGNFRLSAAEIQDWQLKVKTIFNFTKLCVFQKRKFAKQKNEGSSIAQIVEH